MKRLSILLLVVMVSLSSYAINEKKETTKESGSTSFQPEPLDNEWSKWLCYVRSIQEQCYLE